MQIGANGSLALAVQPNGDIQVTVTENDSATSESLVFDVHPAVVAAALTKVLGGGALATEAVALAMGALPAVIAALPK